MFDSAIFANLCKTGAQLALSVDVDASDRSKAQSDFDFVVAMTYKNYSVHLLSEVTEILLSYIWFTLMGSKRTSGQTAVTKRMREN